MTDLWLVRHGESYKNGGTLGLFSSREAAVASFQREADEIDRAEHEATVEHWTTRIAQLEAAILTWGIDYQPPPPTPEQGVYSTASLLRAEEMPTLGESLERARRSLPGEWKSLEPWQDDGDCATWNTDYLWWSVERVTPQ